MSNGRGAIAMIIDSHLHVWSDDSDRYPFSPEIGPGPTQPGSVELLLETMAGVGVDRACLVQSIHYLYDNSYTADCLRRFPGRFAGVALVDRTAPDAAARLEQLVGERGFSGFRIHLTRPEDPAEWAAADQYPVWETAARLGACVQAFGPAQAQLAIEPMIAHFPSVRVVLDHNGGAPVEEAPPSAGLDAVLSLARYDNVYLKLTPQAARATDAYPFAGQHASYQALLRAYGPRRLMWGTDFPHILADIGYRRGLELFRDHMPFLTDSDKEWLLGGTALEFWRFGDPS